MVLALGGTAAADPVNQPITASNCRGVFVAGFASFDPEGVGNFLGGQNVRSFQEFVESFCSEES
jgi:hypothetical protein